MMLIRTREREVVRAVAALVDCNPFLPERMELERRALGDAFVPAATIWHAAGDARQRIPMRCACARWSSGSGPTCSGGWPPAPARPPRSWPSITVRCSICSSSAYEDDWYAAIESAESGGAARAAWYGRFARDVARFSSGVPGPKADPAHLFALGFQVRRAFHHIFRQIFGGSLPAARLRAVVWQSIFTHDGRRYREQLYARMADVPTLILGESGTGKELVARAVALSRYLPFDPRTHTFAAEAAAGFVAVNLSALSPTLIESELFGHQRGAFTGAVQDRRGWFETCGPHGAVFLDEIGEVDGGIQVKLLRVLQAREFQRVGETTPRRFAGKLIAATHRDLSQEMQAGRFRADLYYRICADVIRTPTLREQLAAAPGDLRNLVHIVAGRIAGPDAAERLANEVEAWVSMHLGPEYGWPGNIRELEQCVRNILIRGEYTPPGAPGDGARGGRLTAKAPSADGAHAALSASGGADRFLSALHDGTLTADELLEGYCARVHAHAGSYEEAGRRLGLNWRTVRTKVRAWTTRTRTDVDG